MSGKVAASEIIRALQAGGRLTTLARAISEAGRAPKTIYLLAFIDDENYRRGILVQLNRLEGRHGVPKAEVRNPTNFIRSPDKGGRDRLETCRSAACADQRTGGAKYRPELLKIGSFH